MDTFRPLDIAAADPPLAFNEFAPFNSQAFAVFRADGPGAGPWEMHPETDELLFALAGSVTIEVYGADGNDLAELTAGAMVVVPQGRWHRHVDARELVEMYFTPGESLHSDDPATA